MAIALNPNLNSVFNIQDPEIIAETIQNELGFILNDLAPAKIRQIRKAKAPYMDAKIRQQIKLIMTN